MARSAANLPLFIVVPLPPPNEPKISPSDFYDKPVKDGMFCLPVDSKAIRKLIYNLKISKSPGYGNIGASVVKEVVKRLVRPLAYIYNLSIKTEIFFWKSQNCESNSSLWKI